MAGGAGRAKGDRHRPARRRGRPACAEAGARRPRHGARSGDGASLRVGHTTAAVGGWGGAGALWGRRGRVGVRAGGHHGLGRRGSATAAAERRGGIRPPAPPPRPLLATRAPAYSAGCRDRRWRGCAAGGRPCGRGCCVVVILGQEWRRRWARGEEWWSGVGWGVPGSGTVCGPLGVGGEPRRADVSRRGVCRRVGRGAGKGLVPAAGGWASAWCAPCEAGNPRGARARTCAGADPSLLGRVTHTRWRAARRCVPPPSAWRAEMVVGVAPQPSLWGVARRVGIRHAVLARRPPPPRRQRHTPGSLCWGGGVATTSGIPLPTPVLAFELHSTLVCIFLLSSIGGERVVHRADAPRDAPPRRAPLVRGPVAVGVVGSRETSGPAHPAERKKTTRATLI